MGCAGSKPGKFGETKKPPQTKIGRRTQLGGEAPAIDSNDDSSDSNGKQKKADKPVVPPKTVNINVDKGSPEMKEFEPKPSMFPEAG